MGKKKHNKFLKSFSANLKMANSDFRQYWRTIRETSTKQPLLPYGTSTVMMFGLIAIIAWKCFGIRCKFRPAIFRRQFAKELPMDIFKHLEAQVVQASRASVRRRTNTLPLLTEPRTKPGVRWSQVVKGD